MEQKTADRLRQLKNELNAIKNSNLTDSQFLSSKKPEEAPRPKDTIDKASTLQQSRTE